MDFGVEIVGATVLSFSVSVSAGVLSTSVFQLSLMLLVLLGLF